MKRWEHREENVYSESDLSRTLRNRGEEGWELVAVINDPRRPSSFELEWRLFFKREATDG